MGMNAFNPMEARKGEYCIQTTARPPYCMDPKVDNPTYPGKVNPGFSPSNGPGPGRGNKPSIGTGIGNSDRTNWFNHGKPLNPSTGNGPQRQGAAAQHHDNNVYTNLKKVEFNGPNNGAAQQMTLTVGLTMVIAVLLQRLLA